MRIIAIVSALAFVAMPAQAEWIATAQGDPPSSFSLMSAAAGDGSVSLHLSCRTGKGWAVTLIALSVEPAAGQTIDVAAQSDKERTTWAFSVEKPEIASMRLAAKDPEGVIAWLAAHSTAALSFKTKSGAMKAVTYGALSAAQVDATRKKCGQPAARAPLGYGERHDKWATASPDDLITFAETSLRYDTLDSTGKKCQVATVLFMRISGKDAIWRVICRDQSTWIVAHNKDEGSVAGPCTDPRVASYCR